MSPGLAANSQVLTKGSLYRSDRHITQRGRGVWVSVSVNADRGSSGAADGRHPGRGPRRVVGAQTEDTRLVRVGKHELVDPAWAIQEIKRRFIGNPDFSNLPRKFKTALTGMPTNNDVVHEIHDISFVGVRHPELGPGFDLWVGGGLSTNPRLAQRLASSSPRIRRPPSGPA